MMFRLLGLLAAINLRISRIRIVFVPLNVALAGLLILGVTRGVTRLVQGPAETTPRDVTVADLAAGRVPTGTFVRVGGLVQPNLVLELGKKGFDGKMHSVRERLQLLHDGAGPALWLDAGGTSVGTATRATYVGMVWGLPWAAREATLKEGGTIEGRTPSTSVVLRHGEQPRSFGSGLTELAIGAPLLALFGCVWLRGSEIFRARQGAAVVVPDPDAGNAIDLRASGTFRLDARTSRSFIGVGAEIQWLQGGGIALVAYADASTTVMGMDVVSRAGEWALPVPAGAQLSIVEGEIAFGVGVRPAARVTVHGGSRVIQRFTLSFGSTTQRERVLAFLRSQFPTHRAAA